MARIMGQEITSQDLLPIFDGFLKDLDEVRIGILKHLADFFELLLPKERKVVSRGGMSENVRCGAKEAEGDGKCLEKDS